MTLRSIAGWLTVLVVSALITACTARSDDPVAGSPDVPAEAAGYEEPGPGSGERGGPTEHRPASDGGHSISEPPNTGSTSTPEETRISAPVVGEAGVSAAGAAAPDTEASITGAGSPAETAGAGAALDGRPDPMHDPPGSGIGGPELPDSVRVTGPYRPDMRVWTHDGAIQAVLTGTATSHPEVYTLAVESGQKLEAALTAPPGVSLEVRQGQHVLYVSHAEPRRLETTLAKGGDLWVSVTSSGEEPGEYELTIRIGVSDPAPAPSPSNPVAGGRIQSGDVVYLTFDDGPNPNHTPEVLKILARYGARATFFVVGSLVERYPDIFQQIVAEGHTVANHTWRHENLSGLTREEFDHTIGRTEEILGPYATPCLRPPYAATGSNTRKWAAEHGLDVHLWTVSANDWLGLNATEIADRIVSQVTAGSVVLMHDGGGNRTQTVRGLEMTLERLAGLGLRYEPLCVSGPLP